MITFNIVGNGQHNEGAVNGPEYVAQMFSELLELALTKNETQQYISPSFSITITVS